MKPIRISPLRFLLLALSSFFLAGLAQAQVRPGQTVPAFDTPLLDGKTLPASALRGKAVLVLFWATWCPYCQKELPDLQAAYEKYRGRGFEILALSIDKDTFTVEEFWKDHDYTFPVAMRTLDHVQIFGLTKVTPGHVFIDKKGVVRSDAPGQLSPEKLEAQIRRLL